jgi:hypothetical protein
LVSHPKVIKPFWAKWDYHSFDYRLIQSRLGIVDASITLLSLLLHFLARPRKRTFRIPRQTGDGLNAGGCNHSLTFFGAKKVREYWVVGPRPTQKTRAIHHGQRGEKYTIN